ncbi:hypothetical protein ACH5RR_029157 [Cinchona calisaya]|uniref:Transcription factor n=1 Tax=Cinchona calisaya TaxID=153742 RepID=A0ABD2YT19_9GENT
MGGLVWNDEDRTVVVEVLGTKAFDCLFSSSVMVEGSLMAMGNDENLQNKLSNLVEHPNPTNFGWNYVIFWQISRYKSGELVLGWGDGWCCREPREGEESEVTQIFNLQFEDETPQRMRKRVTSKIAYLFWGSDEDSYAFGLDRVTDIKMFILAFVYFSFPRGRSFLAKSIGMQTIVLIPTDVGVVELSSVRSLLEKILSLCNLYELLSRRFHHLLGLNKR